MRSFIRLSDDVMSRLQRLASDKGMTCEALVDHMLSHTKHKTCTAFRTNDDGYMRIYARYHTRCPMCGDDVVKGFACMWRPGDKALHERCYERANKWPPHRPVQTMGPGWGLCGNGDYGEPDVMSYGPDDDVF